MQKGNQMFSKQYTSISEVYNASTENDVLALKGCVLRAVEPAVCWKNPRFHATIASCLRPWWPTPKKRESPIPPYKHMRMILY